MDVILEKESDVFFRHASSTDLIYQTYTKKLAIATRVAQRSLERLHGRGVCQAMFACADQLIQISRDPMRRADHMVPVNVHVDVASRVEVVAQSLQHHSNHCRSLGFGVHSAARAAVMSHQRDSLKIHRKAGVAKHEWDMDVKAILKSDKLAKRSEESLRECDAQCQELQLLLDDFLVQDIAKSKNGLNPSACEFDPHAPCISNLGLLVGDLFDEVLESNFLDYGLSKYDLFQAGVRPFSSLPSVGAWIRSRPHQRFCPRYRHGYGCREAIYDNGNCEYYGYVGAMNSQ